MTRSTSFPLVRRPRLRTAAALLAGGVLLASCTSGPDSAPAGGTGDKGANQGAGQPPSAADDAKKLPKGALDASVATDLAPTDAVDSALASDPDLKPSGKVITGDINGDGEEDALRLATRTSQNGSVVVVGALGKSESVGQQTVLLPAQQLGVHLTVTDTGASADGVRITVDAHTSAGIVDHRQRRLVITPAAKGAGTAAAWDIGVTPASAGSDGEVSSAKEDHADELKVNNGAPIASITEGFEYSDPILLGRPVEFAFDVPDGQDLVLSGSFTDTQLDAVDADGHQLSIGTDGLIHTDHPGVVRVRIASLAAPTTTPQIRGHLVPTGRHMGAEQNSDKRPETAEQAEANSGEPGGQPDEFVPWNQGITGTSAFPTHTADGKPIAYLTFDDGPGPDTPKVLATLEKYDIPATFFLLGQSAAADPDMVQTIRDKGMKVGGHSQTHPDLTKLGPDGVRRELRDSRKAIGGDLTCMRPPYGASNSRVRSIIAEEKENIVGWTVDPQDWAKPGADTIAKRVVEQTHPGAVILEHDGGGDRSQTVAAMNQYIPQLQAKGYVFRTIPSC
ncbi:polysaccharide deacetylase family protein [Helcobacillus massiliensis]|uniref:polysaccharide deacetylase family protein n=1 Tax=Helcobacillus massiliensis TaxID=521392 RepID=UPI0025538012|nr:polysaccharide deacetylase family protein [Helcobacillus massiliensis]MDK7741259.1 polysaccharide deacetylase family protein [Helcobacillus massiliensis]WOO92886.1 polysaccharide deacetylase family protein [Helcobacillus massiliensis]